MFEEMRYSLLKLDNPVLVERFRPRRLQLRMRLQHAFQDGLLATLEIHEQDMLMVLYGLFKAGKVVVGPVDAE